jgi:hypothetical protein
MGDILRLASKTWCEKTPRAIMYVRGGGGKKQHLEEADNFYKSKGA